MFDLKKIPSQKGKIAVVTGANSGLGYETTVVLAQKGFKVIMACRNKKKAEKAKAQIIKKNLNADLVIMELDLTKLSSVRSFAKLFDSIFKKLDLLINNAGIMVPPFSKTADGFESQMGVNYFSHFLLTGLLLPQLSKGENSRIVSLGSNAHLKAIIDFDNLNSKKGYSKMGAYRQSKLSCLIFSYELQRKLEKAGSSVISVAAHPGVSNTNLGQYLPEIAKIIASLFIPFFTHPQDKAALPIIQAALGLNVKGGDYYGPIGFRNMKGRPGKVTSNKISHNKTIAAKLWRASEELTNFSYKFKSLSRKTMNHLLLTS